MKTTFRSFAALIAGFAIVAGAEARYQCDSPSTRTDRLACEAAEQGPDQLRWFIQRMRPAHSLNFDDYVNKARLLAWEQKATQERATAGAPRPASATAVANADRR